MAVLDMAIHKPSCSAERVDRRVKQATEALAKPNGGGGSRSGLLGHDLFADPK
jgi:hypothetical protein